MKQFIAILAMLVLVGFSTEAVAQQANADATTTAVVKKSTAKKMPLEGANKSCCAGKKEGASCSKDAKAAKAAGTAAVSDKAGAKEGKGCCAGKAAGASCSSKTGDKAQSSAQVVPKTEKIVDKKAQEAKPAFKHRSERATSQN